MKKISNEFIINQYQSGIESYSRFTVEIGLWESEKYVFEKYLKKSDNILDLGCGTGRTTFPLRKLGYEKIIGIDLTPEMIERAKELNEFYRTNLNFKIGDAGNLNFSNSSFDSVIFSFNGLMSIPGATNRKQALNEINRVLQEKGLLIFTTHDRNKEDKFLEFWKIEKEKWDSGKQNSELYEYGDLITNSKNENGKIFIHIPDEEEIFNLMNTGGFEVIETFYRSDKFQENEKVKEKSGECRFWITRKKTAHNNE